MRFLLADESYDEQLRRIVQEGVMPGHIQVAYQREPSFFNGLHSSGTFSQVVAAEEDGKLNGFGCRSIRLLFVNGQATDIGYLSGLRSLAPAKQKMGIVRGYRFLKELHEDQRCPGYLTTIIDGNHEAISTIAQNRAGLPVYRTLGVGKTVAIPLNKRKRMQVSQGFTTRFASPGDEEQVAELLNAFGQQKQFFPAFTKSDFNTPLLNNLPIERFLIAEHHGEECGVAAIWDQTLFKQHIVHGYSTRLKKVLPSVNMLIRLLGYNPLPSEGEMIRSAYICFMAAKNHNRAIMKELFQTGYRFLSSEGFSLCLMGFHETDPAIKLLKGYPKITYKSHVYWVDWENERNFVEQLDERIPAFEPAIL